ncbi:hypothetical protein HRbin02_00632 [Candidatus Calditenuaceae archaeon HR02]|nr:hypothetical protein HRbin02_00632 [Candidatus Calditenuaceae archaeon HR02]
MRKSEDQGYKTYTDKQLSSKKPVRGECILCGETLPIVDALNTRYPCLTTCLRLFNSRHLRGCHGEYLKQSERKAPIYFYTFTASSLSAIVSLLAGNVFAASLFALAAVICLVWGTIVRRRLIKKYAMR